MLEQSKLPQADLACLTWQENQRRQGRVLRVLGWADRPSAGQLSFFAPDFATRSERPWLIGERGSGADLPVGKTDLPLVRELCPADQKEFLDRHARILESLRAREFEKVVPMVAEFRDYAEPLSLGMFAQILERSWKSQYAYGMQVGAEGMCGVTPELLFEVRDGTLQTMALAGTARVEDLSLLQDPKECLEHRLVVENLELDLAKWGRVSLGETTERTYGNLKHLWTPISVRLEREVSMAELSARLHPTAALGGWPREAARNWLERQSFHQTRGRFGAPFGYVDGEDMLCVVAIRGVQWQGARAQIATGCGVVTGSVAEREWNELALKRESILRSLELER